MTQSKLYHAAYRDKSQIFFDILNTIKDYDKHEQAALKLKIIYAARLSSEQLQKYIDELLANQFISVDDSHSRVVLRKDYSSTGRRGSQFHITQKGVKYVEVFNIMKNMGITRKYELKKV